MKMTMKRATTFVAALALAGGTALVASPAASAAPAAGAFSTPAVSGLSTIKLPKKGTKTVSFKVSFTGTASDGVGAYSDTNGDGATVYYKGYGSDYYGPKITRVKSVAKNSVYSPGIDFPNDLATGTNGGYSIRVAYYTTPGVYQVSVPVTQYHQIGYGATTKTTRYATGTFTIQASPKYSKASTGANAPGWKNGGTAKITVRAPEYQTGAKVKGYYRAKGSKTTHYIGKVKLKRSKSFAKGIIKTRKLTRSGKVWFKVGKVKYAGKYTSKKFGITVYRY